MRPDVNVFHYDKQGRKTRGITISQESNGGGLTLMFDSRMFEVAGETFSLGAGGTVTTRYNENDRPIESLVRNSGGELLGHCKGEGVSGSTSGSAGGKVLHL